MMKNSVKFLTVVAALLCAASVGYSQDRLEAPKASGIGLSLSLDYLPRYTLDDGGQDFVMFLNNDDYPIGVGLVTTDPTVGLRYHLSYTLPQGWDVGLSWMQVAAQGTAGVSNSNYGMGALLTSGPYYNQDVFENDFTHAYAALAIEVKTKIIEVGRRVQLSENAGLRVSAGLEQLDVSRDVFGAYHDTDSDATFDSYEEDFSGWGVRMGLQSDWALGQGLGVYSKLGIAMINGQTDMSWFELNPDYNNDRYTVIMPDNRYTNNVTAYELGAGLAYTQKIGGAAAVTAKLGYEYNKLSGLLKTLRFTEYDYMSPNSGALAYDLTMSGAVASLSVSF